MTLLIRDPRFQRHLTGLHPEMPRRLQAIDERLEQSGLLARCRPASYTPATEEQLGTVHDPQQIAYARQVCHRGGGRLESDTVVSTESFAVACAAAGACMSAVAQVLRGDAKTALCLVRPPGHHATPTQSMGFCLFNNIALAARHAQLAHGVNRVLIVDWDVHHGNGTQDIFYRDGTVGFFSIHRYGHHFYPGSGAADEDGSGPGLGWICNGPIAYGTPRAEFHATFRHHLQKLADRVKPELVLVSAGFDAHRDDPIGSLGLDTEDFAVLTREVLAVAAAHAQGRVVSCLEGGYNLQALAESVEVHLREVLAFEERAAHDKAAE